MDSDLALALSFDTDSIDFARGVEVGLLWADLSYADPDQEIEQTIRAANTEMVIRMGESLGRQVVGQQVDENWTEITFGPATAGDAP